MELRVIMDTTYCVRRSVAGAHFPENTFRLSITYTSRGPEKELEASFSHALSLINISVGLSDLTAAACMEKQNELLLDEPLLLTPLSFYSLLVYHWPLRNRDRVTHLKRARTSSTIPGKGKSISKF